MSDTTRKATKLATALEIYKIKDLVNGYIRQQENISRISVPIQLKYFILYFYVVIGECFEKAGDNLCIKDDKLNLERWEHAKTYWQLDNGYTKNWIQSTTKQIVTWKFVVTGHAEFDIIFTLTSNDNCPNSQIVHKRDPYHQKLEVSEIAGGRIVEIKFDTINGMVYLSRDDDFSNILERKVHIANDIKYKLAISISQNGAKVMLNDYVVEKNN